MTHASDPCTPAQRPDRVTAAKCPSWCDLSGAHPYIDDPGVRIHRHKVGQAVAVEQLEHDGTTRPAVIVVDDTELTLAEADGFLRDVMAATVLLAGATL